MKYLNTMILTLILIVLGFFAFQYYNAGKQADLQKQVNELEKELSDIHNLDQDVTNQMQQDINDLNNGKPAPESLAVISGKMCFPSEGIPAMDVYLVNTQNDSFDMVKNPVNTATYKFEDVVPGKYIAFAYPQGVDTLAGAYTPAVPCGLSVECTDHKPTVIEVSAGQTVTNADICDWYTSEGDIPARPE